MDGVVESNNLGTHGKVTALQVGEIFDLDLERMNVMLGNQQSKGMINYGLLENSGDKVMLKEQPDNLAPVMEKSGMELEQFQLNHVKDMYPLGMAQKQDIKLIEIPPELS